MAHPGAAGGAPPMAGIPPLIYQNMNYPLPPNHPTWGHNIRHPRECQSSYHVPAEGMMLWPTFGAGMMTQKVSVRNVAKGG